MSLEESDQQDGHVWDILHELLDNASYRIILSTIDSAKSAGDISSQNNIPLSSTYKRIKKLTKYGLIHVARIEIDDSGKKIVFYKSKVKKMQFGIEGENLSIQFENNALLKTVGLVV
jgi:predicted transcriptional regulator